MPVIEPTGAVPSWLGDILAAVRMRGEGWIDPGRKAAVRSALRFGSFRAAGRNKPSSEYLLAAALAGEFPLVNGPVDVNNGISLLHGYPASIFDLRRAGRSFLLRRGAPGESYVFNRSGQTIDLEDMLCVCRPGAGGEGWTPCGNPVKDSMETKVFGSAGSEGCTLDGPADIAGVVYAPPAGADPGIPGSCLEAACEAFAALLGSGCGAAETGWTIVEGGRARTQA